MRFLFLLLVSCASGVPTIDLEVTPTTLARGGSARARATVRSGELVGTGRVRFEAERGTFSTADVVVDGFGTAETTFRCDDCDRDRVTVTARWESGGTIVKAEAVVRLSAADGGATVFDAGATDAGQPSDAGHQLSDGGWPEGSLTLSGAVRGTHVCGARSLYEGNPTVTVRINCGNANLFQVVCNVDPQVGVTYTQVVCSSLIQLVFDDGGVGDAWHSIVSGSSLSVRFEAVIPRFPDAGWFDLHGTTSGRLLQWNPPAGDAGAVDFSARF